MEENKFIEFLKKHAVTLLLALGCVIVLGIFVDRKLTSRHAHSARDFLVMSQVEQRCIAGELISQEVLSDIEGILKRHPELHASYDSTLALSLLGQQEETQGVYFASRAIDATCPLVPSYYHEFSKTTKLILEKHLDEALKMTCALEEVLKTQSNCERLRAFNLLRMVTLAKELRITALEQSASKTLQECSFYPRLAELFQENDYTLSAYLNHEK